MLNYRHIGAEILAEMIHFPMVISMTDILFVSITLLFFALCFLLVRFFESLSRSE